MENYIGIGTSASSFIDCVQLPHLRQYSTTDETCRWVRRTNTRVINDYIKGKYIDPKKTEAMTEKDYRIEKVFLALRTQAGIEDVSVYTDLFIPSWKKKLQERQQAWFVDYYDDILVLTDKGMDMYNSIITDLFEKL